MSARPSFSPLNLIAMKQKVGQADADTIALPLLAHLDGAKRGRGSVGCHQFLTLHLIIAVAIASQIGARKFYDQGVAAYAALEKSAARPTKELDLTTGEYKVIRAAFASYLCALPQLEIATMYKASQHAARVMA